MLKKVMFWAGAASLILIAAFRPEIAADAVKTVGQGLIDIGTGVGRFFNGLVS